MLPPNVFPPATTMQHYFYMCGDAGVWPSINQALVTVACDSAGHKASPTGGGSNLKA